MVDARDNEEPGGDASEDGAPKGAPAGPLSSAPAQAADDRMDRIRALFGGVAGALWRHGPRWLGRGALGFVVASVLWVGLYGFVNPPGTLLMLREQWRLGAVAQDWRALEAISPNMRRAAIAAEDSKFCAHWGVDVDEMRRAIRSWRNGGRLRGASTISQQTAKNAFLWSDRSIIRKGLEFWFTGLIELMWSKQRILEVYLNVAEFDEGVFGVEAAAQSVYGRAASELSIGQAAQLAAVLPAPRVRDPKALGPDFGPRLRNISVGAGDLAADGRDACAFRGGEDG